MTRLVLKLLLKVSLPLALLVGTLSYGVYLRGGDPLALMRTVGAGIGADVADRGRALAARAGDGARGGGAVLSGADGEAGGPTEVWTWQDADGVTHFSSVEPVDAVARTVTVDPRTNVLAPLPSGTSGGRGDDDRPTPAAARPDGAGRGASPALSGGLSGGTGAASDDALPGMAGLLQGGGGTNVSPAQAERMLRLLQGRSLD